MFYLTDKPIDEIALKLAVHDVRAGAVVTFDGRVRNHNEGKAVSKLAYEAYEALAVREGIKIIDEARQKFSIIEARAAHRTGELEIGDVAVFVAVSAAHRDDAFKACRYLIDEVKMRLPIWKKETYVDGGSVWVNCQSCANNHNYEVSHSGEKSRA